MTAAILTFPRWRRSVADCTPAAIMRRVRFAALHAGCPAHQLPAVEAYADVLLATGHSPHYVITAARSYAAQVVEQVSA